VKHLSLIILLLIIGFTAQAQIKINEFSAANFSNWYDPSTNETPDWVELMNTGSASIDLMGWALSDAPDDLSQYVFNSYTLNAGERVIIVLDNRDLVMGGIIHTNFKITQTKPEGIILVDATGTVADQYEITTPNVLDHSFARFPDGTGDFKICTAPTPGAENTGSDYFSSYSSTPSTNLPAGFYATSQTVTLNTTTGNTVRYTTDGSMPDETSTLYTLPISVTDVTVLRARAFSSNPDITPGHEMTNTYFVGIDHVIPVVSIAGGENVDILLDGDWGSNPIASIEIFGDDGVQWCEGTGNVNKHGNDSWAYDQRGFDWITRDEMGITNELDYQIFGYRDRDEFQRLILKPAANDNYPTAGGAHIRDAYVHLLAQRAEMVLDCRSYEPCIVYKNGAYWGVYEMREKVDDHDYTSHYYGQGEKYIDYIKTWGGTWEEYGSVADWNTLHNYITSNDMSIQANYDYAASELEMLSLIDYFLINNHTVCTDWLNYNTSWWRGSNPDGQAQKWRYALWDLDATFGHYINYTGVPSTNPDADPCQANDLSSDFEGHGELIEALLENETFHSLYVNRYSDMLNTYFSCDTMIGMLDELLDRIEPEMPGQIAKWGGTMAQWEANVLTLKDFILARCTTINEDIEDCYEVEGPYSFSVTVSPAGMNHQVVVNANVPISYPFTANYFAGVNIPLTAVPGNNWVFDHWEYTDGSIVNNFVMDVQYGFVGPADVTAVFIPESPCGPIQNIIVDSTNTTISLNWDTQSAADFYEVGYKKAGTLTYQTINIQSGNVILGNLESCADYDVRIRSVCTDPPVNDYLQLSLFTKCPPPVIIASQDLMPMAVSVWPNPADELLQIAVQGAGHDLAAQVITTDGRVLLDQFLALGNDQIATLDISTLTTGLYLLRVYDSEGRQMSKTVFVK
jgi:CotH kinase protein/Lamin Tail Domain/Chitobiase/beta-hexosaminidase C-terminal domain/Secretion system C-terminal sorting domain